jgi:hypothetical protein
MKTTKAGPSAGNEPVRAPTTREVSPVARKFAEYIARHLAPKLERAAQQHPATPAGPQHSDER